jgi:hypothetical protein
MEVKETATMDKIEAAKIAFGNERLRWLIGKGDVLVQEGELTDERFKDLVKSTVRDEIERSAILNQLEKSTGTVTEISKAVSLEDDRTLWNLIALMKWNKVDIVGEKDREYIYAIKEM